MAAAGPLVSLIAGAGLLVVTLVGELAGGGPLHVIGRVALVIGVMNLLLGGVNLLPAFPLDGGRIVRGLAWARTGDPARALQIAASSGRYLGILFATGRDRRHPHRGLDRRPDARGVRLVPRLERQHASSAAPRST